LSTRRAFVRSTCALASLGLPRAARAQGSPDLARILCGFPAGGTSDAMSRRIADKLRGSYAPNVVVENKTGAGGQAAIAALKDSASDGSVMLLTPSSMLSIYPYVYKSLPYRPLEDVQPVSLVCYFNHALGIGPAVPGSVKTFRDFAAWASANPDKASVGSPGAGSMPHLIVSLLGKIGGPRLRHVPYRGSAPGIQDLLAGRVSAMSSPVGDYLPHLEAGRLRLLAISGPNRSPFVPEVPTYRQHGFPITVREWYGLFLPGAASGPLVRRAAAYLQPALAQPDLVADMAQRALEVQASTPQALGELLRSDSEEWRRLIKLIGFTPES
jgi:tripartite-type tricarboxylate transporter receptor subunit TctC